MAKCELGGKCGFFDERIEKTPGMARLFQQHYCDAEDPTCARLMVHRALGPEKVPPNLFPNDHQTASTLLDDLPTE